MVSVIIYGDNYREEDWLKDHKLSAAFVLTVIAFVLYLCGGLALIIMSYLCKLEEVGDEFHYILNCPYFIYN
jgi:hypothetical protein